MRSQQSREGCVAGAIAEGKGEHECLPRLLPNRRLRVSTIVKRNGVNASLRNMIALEELRVHQVVRRSASNTRRVATNSGSAKQHINSLSTVPAASLVIVCCIRAKISGEHVGKEQAQDLRRLLRHWYPRKHSEKHWHWNSRERFGGNVSEEGPNIAPSSRPTTMTNFTSHEAQEDASGLVGLCPSTLLTRKIIALAGPKPNNAIVPYAAGGLELNETVIQPRAKSSPSAISTTSTRAIVHRYKSRLKHASTNAGTA